MSPLFFVLSIMRCSTAYNHVAYFQAVIDRVFRGAIYSYPSMVDLNASLQNEVFSTQRFKRLPIWAKDALVAHRRYWRERIMRDHVAQLYVLPDGRKVICRNAWDSFPEEIRERVRKGEIQLPIKTFWLSSTESCTPDGVVTRITTPTDRVFFDSLSS